MSLVRRLNVIGSTRYMYCVQITYLRVWSTVQLSFHRHGHAVGKLSPSSTHRPEMRLVQPQSITLSLKTPNKPWTPGRHGLQGHSVVVQRRPSMYNPFLVGPVSVDWQRTPAGHMIFFIMRSPVFQAMIVGVSSGTWYSSAEFSWQHTRGLVADCDRLWCPTFQPDRGPLKEISRVGT